MLPSISLFEARKSLLYCAGLPVQFHAGSEERISFGAMDMWLDPKRYEIMDDQMAEIMRSKTPGQRLAIVNSMWRMGRGLIQSMLRHDHPDWSDEEIGRETSRRLLRGAL
jgi:hypothetical protein